MKKRITNSLYLTFLGFITKKGDIKKADRTLSYAFFLSSQKTKMPLQNILVQLFLNLNCFVEVKRIKSRKSTKIVPFSIKFKRRLYLAVKWIMAAVNQDKRRTILAEKLSLEIINVVEKRASSKALKAKELNIKEALANRSNTHFRW